MSPNDAFTARSHAMRLLAAGVPLSLLCDLAEPDGVDSTSIFLDEAPSAVIDVATISATGLERARSDRREATRT